MAQNDLFFVVVFFFFLFSAFLKVAFKKRNKSHFWLLCFGNGLSNQTKESRDVACGTAVFCDHRKVGDSGL